MDKNRVTGTINEVVGSTKRQAGKMTGNTRTEVSGAAQELKGKVQKTVGKMKDAARDGQDRSSAARKVKP